jgi:hypothetical protein
MLPDWKPFAVNPGRKKVAIVGFASSSRDEAPWADPAYELWGMNQAYSVFHRAPDRWFEIHTNKSREDASFPNYFDDIREVGCPIYMVDRDPAFPTSLKYPLDEVVEGLPAQYRRFFTSSAAYMIALAIHEGFETIAVYGVDCAVGTEYELQKGCIEAWLSLAVGRGIEIIVPAQSALFKNPFLYGYEQPRTFPRVLRASEAFLRRRVEEYQIKHNEALENVHKCEGAIRELTELMSFAESKGRGAAYPSLEVPDDGR